MTSWVLAEQTMQDKIAIFRQMGSRFEETDPNLHWKIPVVILLFMLAILLAWILYALQSRRQGTDQSPRPLRLYFRAMRELGIAGPDIWQLWRLAKRLHLKHPTALLISPQYFDQAATTDCCDKSGRIVSRSRHQRLMAIRAVIFGPDVPAG